MKKIYLDHNATTPLDPRVFDKMKLYFAEEFGNPSSESHSWGWTAQKAVADARKNVGELMGALPQEIVFTSGSTEATNLAILGTVLHFKLVEKREKIHVVTTAAEHGCVLASIEFLKKFEGVETEVLPVNSYGQLEPETLKKAIQPHTVLVSAIWVNNEIGSINPVHELGKICREHGVLFHSDATQALGKVQIDLQNQPIDLLSVSAHKAYGPKGAGALYLRSKNPRVQIQPLMVGGGQEKNLRSGTLNVPGIVGFGETCKWIAQEWHQDAVEMSALSLQLLTGMKEIFPDLILNGHPAERSPVNLNVTLPSFHLDLALPHLLRIGMSRGSACHSAHSERSHVLKSIGVSPQMAERTLRLSIGKTTTKEEIAEALSIFKEAKVKLAPAFAQSRQA